jgi:hypothetical protein
LKKKTPYIPKLCATKQKNDHFSTLLSHPVQIKLFTFKLYNCIVGTSVAEPELEPVEQQLLLEPEPKFFWSGSGAGYVNSYNMLQKP